MVKTLSEIKQDLKLVDIVCVVLDARIPYVSNNKELYNIIAQKSVIIVFNKSDLADKASLDVADEKYKKDGCYTIRTNSLMGEGIGELLSLIRELGTRIKNKINGTEDQGVQKTSTHTVNCFQQKCQDNSMDKV